MINPTLFIGLGSTGLDIIERFQELVLEHYGRASLDIFKYIAIETREAAEVTRSEWGENEIKLLKPVIRGTDAIKASIDSGHKQYLRDWLNPKLLEISGGQFTDGAANIRMAGRLILWENWNNIQRAINNAYNQITGNRNIRETEVFLNNHYARHGQPIDARQPLVGDLPNVYIVGTFCGGTCSGMFIDIGYYTKQITGLYARNLLNPNLAKVIGIFSNFDAATLKSAQQQGIRLHAANSWAALMEYDFFCHSQTRCQITFPDGTFVDTNERPIDWLYLISCTATNSNNTLRSNFRKSDGKPDEESLSHMAATILFTETVGGLLGEKDGIRINYRASPRSTETNENEHSPCIATSGIATIWYPKYRIALGAACKYGASLCEEWVGKIDPNTRQIIEKDIPAQWYNMLNQSIDELVSSPSANIMEDIKQELDKNRDRYIKLPATQFKDYLQEILSRLNKGETCDTHISGRVSSFKKKLTKDISDFIKDIIDTKSDLAYTEYSLEQLDEAIANTIGRLPSEYPAPDLSRVEEVSSSDILGRLVFKTKEMERQRKEDILSDVKIYMENQIKKIRNFRMGTILEEIREEIGIGRSLPQVKVDAGMVTVKQFLDNVKSSLDNCIKYLKGRYKELGKDLAHTEDVRVVSDGSHEVIKDDIVQVVAQLKNISPEEKQVILNGIKSSQTLSHFLGFGFKEGKAGSIKEKITEQLIREVLERIGSFNVINHVLGNWTASEIAEFAKHGLPHLELTPGSSGLASVKIGSPVSFVAGGYEQELDSLVQNTLAGTSCQGLFERSLFLPELSHMLMFYREEPLMYIDDNLATATLFEKCYHDAERATKYGLHIHKGGKNIFDPQIYARRDKIENELMPIAVNIFSIRDKNGNWTSSDIFKVEKKRLILRDIRKSGAKFRLTGDESGIELCAQEREIFEYFNNLMEDKLENMTKDNFIERLNSYLDWIEIKAEEEGKDPGPIMEEERRKIMEIPLIKKLFAEETED